MKDHSSSRANKGSTTFGTPHGWRANRPENIKKGPKQRRGKMSGGFNTTNSSHFGGRGR